MLTGVADLEKDFMRSPQWGGGGERGEGRGVVFSRERSLDIDDSGFTFSPCAKCGQGT